MLWITSHERSLNTCNPSRSEVTEVCTCVSADPPPPRHIAIDAEIRLVGLPQIEKILFYELHSHSAHREWWLGPGQSVVPTLQRAGVSAAERAQLQAWLRQSCQCE